MAEVKTQGLYYEPGSFTITQGHKYGEKSHYKKSGAFVDPIGFGNATETTTSKFYMHVETPNGKTSMVRIDGFFKERGKRITEKRRGTLEDTMPDYVNLITKVSDYGKEYVTVSDEDMKKWCKAAKIKL